MNAPVVSSPTTVIVLFTQSSLPQRSTRSGKPTGFARYSYKRGTEAETNMTDRGRDRDSQTSATPRRRKMRHRDRRVMASSHRITGLLQAWSQGDDAALAAGDRPRERVLSAADRRAHHRLAGPGAGRRALGASDAANPRGLRPVAPVRQAWSRGRTYAVRRATGIGVVLRPGRRASWRHPMLHRPLEELRRGRGRIPCPRTLTRGKSCLSARLRARGTSIVMRNAH